MASIGFLLKNAFFLEHWPFKRKYYFNLTVFGMSQCQWLFNFQIYLCEHCFNKTYFKNIFYCYIIPLPKANFFILVFSLHFLPAYFLEINHFHLINALNQSQSNLQIHVCRYQHSIAELDTLDDLGYRSQGVL